MSNSIHDELSSLMGDLANKASSPVEPTPAPAPAASTPAEPVEPVAEPKEPVEPVEPSDDNQVEPQNVDDLEDVVPAEPVEPELIDDWDSDSISDPDPQKPVNDEVYLELGKAVGLEEIKSKDELINRVKELKEGVEKANEEKKSLLESIPEDLVKAVELAKQNGDYLSYLGVSSVDYSKVDPIDLYEAYVEDSLANPDGTVDYDKVDEYLDSLSDVDKELRGKQLKAQYIETQNQKKVYLQAQAEESRIRKERLVKEAVDKLNVVNGFKVSPSHKQELYNDLVSDPLKDYRKGNSLDYEKMVKDRFIVKYYEKLDRFRQTQIKNGVKREMLNEITNPQITKPGTVAAPEKKKEGYSLADLLNDVSKVKY